MIRDRGNREYELSNHLGNVLSVVSDYKVGGVNGNPWEAAYYEADVKSVNDYYAFGLGMPGRNYNSPEYRYGFNGKEKDEDGELGELTHYDYGFRIYNPGIGRFLSVDPLLPNYPMLTPYQFASNTPIAAIDVDGLEKDVIINSPIVTSWTKSVLKDRDIEAAFTYAAIWDIFGKWPRLRNYEDLTLNAKTFRSLEGQTFDAPVIKNDVVFSVPNNSYVVNIYGVEWHGGNWESGILEEVLIGTIDLTESAPRIRRYLEQLLTQGLDPDAMAKLFEAFGAHAGGGLAKAMPELELSEGDNLINDPNFEAPWWWPGNWLGQEMEIGEIVPVEPPPPPYKTDSITATYPTDDTQLRVGGDTILETTGTFHQSNGENTRDSSGRYFWKVTRPSENQTTITPVQKSKVPLNIDENGGG